MALNGCFTSILKDVQRVQTQFLPQACVRKNQQDTLIWPHTYQKQAQCYISQMLHLYIWEQNM